MFMLHSVLMPDVIIKKNGSSQIPSKSIKNILIDTPDDSVFEVLKVPRNSRDFEDSIGLGMKFIFELHVPYACHYYPRLVYLLPQFTRPFLCFQGVFSENYVLMYM